jgi:hypothetical protein
VTISWAATSPESGRFVPAERSGVGGLAARFEELRAQGQGYLEVRAVDQPSTLTLGFKGSTAVIQCISDDGTMLLLLADTPGLKDVEVPVMDDPVKFTTDFVLDLDQAWRDIEEFIRTGDAIRVGNWCEL